MITNKYEFIEKINSGSFGSIYKGKNKRTGELVAIKTEIKNNDIKTLKAEAKLYQYFGKLDGFPQLKWFGTTNNINYLVIDLLGNSLKNIIIIYKLLRLKSVIQIGVQMIKLIECLHKKYLLHRDIKPDNFLFGLDNKLTKLHIIDFGLCKRYEYENGHIEENKISKIIGTPNFVSLNVHRGIEPSRRDDIESCIYILLYLYFGKLEWEECKTNIEIFSKKEKIVETEDVPMFIKNLLYYVRFLKFNEKPDYEYIINTMKKVYTDNGFIEDNVYEWN